MNIQGFTPSVAAPQMASNAVAPRATTSSSSSSSSTNSASATSSSSLQTTFLNLLVTELQNQDPTSPVDPTAMVGQMVSLNQLDQLISINQTLGNMSGSTAATSSNATANAVVAADSGSAATSSPAVAHLATSTAASQELPAYTPMSDPNALMNLYGSFGTPAATSSSTTSGGR
jgi:flagellar basal-body rod modification protein FlgD